MPSPSDSGLPALGLPQLEELERIEARLCGALERCADSFGDRVDENKALDYLKAYSVEMFNFYRATYRKVPGFTPTWIDGFRTKAVDRALGCLKRTVKSRDYWIDSCRKSLLETPDLHIATLPPAAPSPDASLSHSPFLSFVRERDLHIQQPIRAMQIPEWDSTAEQLKRLQSECDLTVQQMADALGINLRSIFRHLAGNALPRRGHLAAYQKLFSEKLGKPVILKNVMERHKKS